MKNVILISLIIFLSFLIEGCNTDNHKKLDELVSKVDSLKKLVEYQQELFPDLRATHKELTVLIHIEKMRIDQIEECLPQSLRCFE